MIQDVIKALAAALKSELSESETKYTIYTENVKQGLKQPCFFIYCREYKDELFRGSRYRLSTNICIEYIPPEEETNANVNEMLALLYDVTEYIEVDGNVLAGFNRQTENTEDSIVFSVQYEYFYYKSKNENIEIMEDLTERIGADG